MNQEKYIGMDVHQATISAAVMDAHGKLLMEGRNLGCLATPSPETPCQPAGSLRSAKGGSVERGQQE
jgi:hypothetical protein